MSGVAAAPPPVAGAPVPQGEPDYRFTLANERTFLSWIRTSLALLAGGLATRQLVGPFEIEGAHTVLAAMAVALSLVLAVASYLRWRRIDRAMRRGEGLTQPLAAPILAMGVVTLAVVVGMLVLFG